MKKAVKNILVYADGRTVELTQELLGARFIKPEVRPNGDWWYREFEVHLAMSAEDGPYVAVGTECGFYLSRTAAEVARADEERRRKTMRAALWGIANYPGDDESSPQSSEDK